MWVIAGYWCIYNFLSYLRVLFWFVWFLNVKKEEGFDIWAMVKHVTRVGEEGVCGGQKDSICFICPPLIFDNSLSDKVWEVKPFLLCVFKFYWRKKNRKLVHRDKRKPLWGCIVFVRGVPWCNNRKVCHRQNVDFSDWGLFIRREQNQQEFVISSTYLVR